MSSSPKSSAWRSDVELEPRRNWIHRKRRGPRKNRGPHSVRGNRGSGNALGGLLTEDVDGGWVDTQAHLLAALRRTTRRDTSDDLVGLSVLDRGLLAGADEGSVEVGVSAELLDDGNVESDALAGEGEGLWTDAEGELGLVRGLGQDLAGNRNDVVTELDATIDGGEPMKPATKRFFGVS